MKKNVIALLIITALSLLSGCKNKEVGLQNENATNSTEMLKPSVSDVTEIEDVNEAAKPSEQAEKKPKLPKLPSDTELQENTGTPETDIESQVKSILSEISKQENAGDGETNPAPSAQ